MTDTVTKNSKCNKLDLFKNRLPLTMYFLHCPQPGNTNYFRLAHFYMENIIFLFTKQATLMRRSTVQSLPNQLVFPATTFIHWQYIIPSIKVFGNNCQIVLSGICKFTCWIQGKNNTMLIIILLVGFASQGVLNNNPTVWLDGVGPPQKYICKHIKIQTDKLYIKDTQLGDKTIQWQK
jgi:hypothetical protein